MKMKWSGLALALGALVFSAAANAAPPSAAMLSNACGGCHGTHGASAGPSMPSLAGQSKVFFIDAMKKFRSGDRPGTVMSRLAKGYTDEQIVAMADFFAKQKPQAQDTAVNPALVAKGKTVYDNACKRCHLENGKEFEEDTPIVAGQWLTYLQIQMNEFQSGARKMSEKKAEKVKPLTAADWEAVAHFYASQK
ncbi:MAG: c-type cytochrome [Gammaproteobacteria bacterium]|nr:c-type cytochrome [Gammaproteobacteria bacterium]MBU1777578.1 c-type cytochrome [Gammaproteobacteria bacterium]MBU1969920.1 c-type cytochrome [Gammaproteobacteria bacterium]